MFMPARLGPTARLGSPARLRPASRLGLPAGLNLPARPRPLDCDGPCSFGEVIESCSLYLEFGCSCDSPRRCSFLWSFSFCSALRRYLVSYPRIIDHLPFICLDHGVKREVAMGRRCGFGDKTRTQNTGQGRAERIAQKAPESNQRKGHEAAHVHDCRGDFRPCYRCTPLPAQTSMGGR